jgi:hypothetical protein
VRVERGRVRLERADAAPAKPAATTARVMGRHAIELYVGRELLDRVRFDVPLAGDAPPEPSPRRPFRRPTFEQVTTRMRATIADHPRAAWMQLVDRATGEAQRFFWPPEADGRLVPFAVPSADVGADAPPPADAAPPFDGGAPADASPDATPVPADAGR